MLGRSVRNIERGRLKNSTDCGRAFDNTADRVVCSNSVQLFIRIAADTTWNRVYKYGGQYGALGPAVIVNVRRATT